METGAFWVNVYGPGWDQCMKVDRVDWSADSLAAFVGELQVMFVHLVSVDAVFVSRGSGAKKS